MIPPLPVSFAIANVHQEGSFATLGGAAEQHCSARSVQPFRHLIRQPERDCNVQLHRYGLFVQIRRLILPLSYRVDGSLYQ